MRLLLLLLLPVFPVIASQDTLKHSHIRKFRNGLIIGPVIKYRYPSIEFNGPDKDYRRIVFRPNSNLVAGFRVNVFGINIEIARSLTRGFLNQDLYGISKASDITLNTMQRKWFGDVQFIRYNGLYFRKSWASNPSLTVPSREDLRIRNRSISFTRIFKPERFSYRGAYLFRERQEHSAGSPLLRFSLNSVGFEGNQPLIDQDDVIHFTALDQLTEVHYTALGIAPGYSYTWVWRDLFVNGTVLAGAAHYWARYGLAGKPDRYDIQFNFISTFGMAAGYNGDRYFAGVTYRGQGFRLKREDIRITGSQNAFVIMAGIRLQERGVMKKRVTELKKILPKPSTATGKPLIQ